MTGPRPRGDGSDGSSRSRNPEGKGGQLTRTLAKARERRLSEGNSDEEKERAEWESGLNERERQKWEKDVEIEWKKEKSERTKPVIEDRRKLNEEFEVLGEVTHIIEAGYTSYLHSSEDFFQSPINQALDQISQQIRQDSLPAGAPYDAFTSGVANLINRNATIRTLVSHYTAAVSEYVQRCDNHNGKFSDYYDTYNEERDLKPIDTKEEESNLKLNFPRRSQ